MYREGAERATSLFDTQKEAIPYARELAKKHNGTFISTEKMEKFVMEKVTKTKINNFATKNQATFSLVFLHIFL